MQAVMSSDFSIAQFRYLETLLLVHGRWSYLRITRMVLFFFYKNLLFGLTIFFFNCVCFFSGQTLYNGEFMCRTDMILPTVRVAARVALSQPFGTRSYLCFVKRHLRVAYLQHSAA